MLRMWGLGCNRGQGQAAKQMPFRAIFHPYPKQCHCFWKDMLICVAGPPSLVWSQELPLFSSLWILTGATSGQAATSVCCQGESWHSGGCQPLAQTQDVGTVQEKEGWCWVERSACAPISVAVQGTGTWVKLQLSRCSGVPGLSAFYLWLSRTVATRGNGMPELGLSSLCFPLRRVSILLWRRE